MTSPTMDQETNPADEPSSPLPLIHEAGVFLLKDEPSHDGRTGATATSWTESDSEVSQAHSNLDLPMIVWLRGDEPWFNEFDLDADGVMQQLGIKRSRLTQISGKELRVGRIRVDRYVRPIYRSQDVEAYLTWTRATASHQRSSSAIKEAVDALQSQGSQIAQVVEAANETFKGTLEAGLGDKIREATAESFTSLAAQVHEMNIHARDTLDALQFTTARAHSEIKGAIDRQASIAGTQWNTVDIRLDGVETATAAVSLRLAEVSEKIERLLSKQSHVEDALKQNLEAMATLSETIKVVTSQNQLSLKQRHGNTKKRRPGINPAQQQQTALPIVSFKERNSRLRSKKKS